MSVQLALILPFPQARATDPHTSKEAARKAATFANNHRDRIHAALADPMTPREIAQASGIDYIAVQRRLKEMQAMGLIEETGIKREGCREWRRT